MRGYAGESPGKKVARVWAYRAVQRDLLPCDLKRASIFCLAGPEAADLGPIRAFGLTDDPASVFMVDVDRTGLDAAARIWPGVRTFHGAVQDCQTLPRPLDLAVVDLCGSVEGQNAVSMFRCLRKSLKVGSCLVVTFLRGRETPDSGIGHSLRLGDRMGHSRTWVRAIKSAIIVADSMKMQFAFDAKGIRESDIVLELRHAFTYRANGNTTMEMCTMRVSRMYEFTRRYKCQSDRPERFIRSSDELPHVRPRDRLELLSCADSLERNGFDPCLALNVKPATLAAWRAHRTMGTYRRGEEAA